MLDGTGNGIVDGVGGVYGVYGVDAAPRSGPPHGGGGGLLPQVDDEDSFVGGSSLESSYASSVASAKIRRAAALARNRARRHWRNGTRGAGRDDGHRGDGSAVVSATGDLGRGPLGPTPPPPLKEWVRRAVEKRPETGLRGARPRPRFKGCCCRTPRGCPSATSCASSRSRPPSAWAIPRAAPRPTQRRRRRRPRTASGAP